MDRVSKPFNMGEDANTNESQFSLKDRTALITGGARGCGLAFAEGLAEAGADVAIFDVIPPVEAFFEIEKKFGVKTAHYLYVYHT